LQSQAIGLEKGNNMKMICISTVVEMVVTNPYEGFFNARVQQQTGAICSKRCLENFRPIDLFELEQDGNATQLGNFTLETCQLES